MFAKHVQRVASGEVPENTHPHDSCGGQGCHSCDFKGWKLSGQVSSGFTTQEGFATVLLERGFTPSQVGITRPKK